MITMEDYMFGDWLDSFFYDSANTVQSTIQVSDPKHNMALSFHKYGGVMPENYQNVFGPGAAPPTPDRMDRITGGTPPRICG